ncbi:hypothetical protein JCM17823_02570 [Halorubrum gandharaense]
MSGGDVAAPADEADTDAGVLAARLATEVATPHAARAASRIDDDPVLREAADTWATFVREAHGDVFAQTDADPTAAFADALAYDRVVDELLDVVEDGVGVRVTNREPSANTDLLDVAFDDLHDRIGGEESADSPSAVTADAVIHTLDDGLLRELHERVVSPAYRRALGQYYTPRGVADLAIDELPEPPASTGELDRVLDPGCGSGVFLAAAVERALDGFSAPPDGAVRSITDAVVGFDLDPLAVKSAKLRYLAALAEPLSGSERETVSLPVFLVDAVGITHDTRIRFRGEPFAGGIDADTPDDPIADHLVGNPPWITWSDLPDSVRDAWRSGPVDRLGLSVREGAESLLGHANDDVSVPFLWTCIDRHLARGGTVSVVCKRGLMKGPAGRLFREGSVGHRRLAPARVHDFTHLAPFGDGVNADAAVYTLRADREPTFPVPAVAWSRPPGDGVEPTDTPQRATFDSVATMRRRLARQETGLTPVDPEDPAGSWVRTDADRRALGECEVPIRHGVKDDAAAVFGMDDADLDRVEPDRVFPYLKSKHVVKFGLFGHEHRLVPMDAAHEDNEAALRDACPETYAYLQDHRDRLAARSSSWLEKGPFYNVFGLGEYTWAPYKVVWCRLGFKPHFVVVSTVDDDLLGEKLVVPGDHCMFVPTDDEREAHFLCGLLNSESYRRAIEAVTGGGKSGLSKSVVSELALPEYPDTEAAERVADLSREAHGIVPEHVDVSKRAYNRTTIPELAAVRARIDETVDAMLAAGELPTEAEADVAQDE